MSAVSVSRTMARRRITLKPSACSGVFTSEQAHPEFAKVMAVNGITAKDAGTMLALLKVARIATGSSPDSFIDLAGYAACTGEIVTNTPHDTSETVRCDLCNMTEK